MIKNRAYPDSDLSALHHVRRSPGIEIENQHGRRFDLFGQRKGGVKFNCSQICHPNQRGKIVGQNVIYIAIVAFAPDRHRLYPRGTVNRGVFLKEKWLVHSIGIALQRERSSGEVWHEYWGNASVIVDYLALGKSRSRIQDLLQIG